MQSTYDALIVAAALDGGCTRLHSEDMPQGLEVTTSPGSRVLIGNPFAAA
jgi:predicted nucleic acid-binding protein